MRPVKESVQTSPEDIKTEGLAEIPSVPLVSNGTNAIDTRLAKIEQQFSWAKGAFAVIIAISATLASLLWAKIQTVQELLDTKQSQIDTMTTKSIERIRLAAQTSASWMAVDEPIGPLPLIGRQAVAYDIPTIVPKNATEILIFVSGFSHNSNGGDELFKITVEVADQRPFVMFRMFTSTQLAFAYNSDNIWLPMPDRGRKIFVQRIGNDIPTAAVGDMRIIGYRSPPENNQTGLSP